MSAAFLRSQNGNITGVVSAIDHGDLRNTLLEWALDESTDMIIRVPIDLARQSLFGGTELVLAALEIGAAQ